MPATFFLICGLLFIFGWSSASHALTTEQLTQLTQGDVSAKVAVINTLAAAGDATALPVLQALYDGTLHTTAEGRVVLLTAEETIVDPVTRAPIMADPATLQSVTINNRVRRAIETALSALNLFSSDRATRLAAIQQLETEANAELLPLLDKALSTEQDPQIKETLIMAHAALQLKSSEKAQRLAAINRLGSSDKEAVKSKLMALLEKDAAGHPVEPDADIRRAAQDAMESVARRLKTAEIFGNVFSGISLGSVLLLAALGLAIIYGLMGVINMAHGEFLMIGAYATYVMQQIFRAQWPEYVDYYLIAALPMAFFTTALIGMLLERGVIRHLYGRPLETLLATWGISLILIQTVRAVFGAQNVEVANPSWMSGGVSVLGSLVLPYNRMVIIGFAFAVLLAVWLLLTRTRLGLFMRAVTQNRRMADCVGVPTGRVDMWAFGLGAGVAGLGGVALSQIGNVGPELGQNYIVDSFMVVVLGGVGQIAGTVYAALGLGVINKFLEPYWGAVLGKIFVLALIILVIQKRPQGLFALKGRQVEA